MPLALSVVAPVLIASAVGAAPVIDLAGPWSFQAGDDPAWAEPAFDDGAWATVTIPTGWGRRSPVSAMAWYRRRLLVDPAAAREPPGLAVHVGKVDSAYELYAGGRLLGGVGGLPPDPVMDYDRHRTWVVPPSAVASDGAVVLAMRVWKSPDTESSVGGPVEGRFLLGPSVELERRVLLGEMVQLFLGILFVLVGLYHLQLFRRRPTLREYLWYALVAFDAGLYCLLRTQWKYALTDRFVPLKELEYVALFLLPALFVQFVWPLVGAPLSGAVRLHQAWTVGLAAVVGLTPGLWLNTHVLPLWELSLLPLVAATLVLLARQSWRGQPEARTIGAGLSLFMLFALHDVAVDRGIVSTPRVTAFGFAAFVLAMAVSLANRFSRAQSQLAALGRELEERVAARTEELARRTEEASAANLAKGQFLATMSHEIRTPLNAVIGMTGLVLDSPLSAEQREALEIVRRSGATLLDLVNDVLDFSKIESGRLGLETQPFSPRACIEEALEVVAGRAAEKGLDLAYVAEPTVPALVRGDPTRVRQVLVNLLGNAVKFSATGGVMVTARGGGGPDEMRVTVADTGIGVPLDRRDRLFQMFSQADASHTREYGGTGLGLAISRRLCELMGGTLFLGAEPGPGAVFHLSFRAETLPGPVPSVPAAHGRELAGLAVLVAGAGPQTRRMVEACLASWGMSAQVAHADDAAVEIVRRGGTSIALVGFGPDGAGARLAERLRGPRVAGELPIVAFGPLTARQEMARAQGLGVVARLVTPLRPAHLHAALLEAIGVPTPASRREVEPPPRAPEGARPLRVLVAEDNVVSQKVILLMLQRQGYRADVAGNGREVLEALGRQAYDVVLLDVQMPEIDGLETARRIRAGGDPGPWIIALTANALRGDREACLAAGMDDYLSKPVSPAALAAALGRAAAAGEGARAAVTVPGSVPGDGDPHRDAAGEAPVLERAPLEQLRRMGGAEHRDLVGTLVRDFIRDVPRRLASMEEARVTGDRETLERLAHSLKGSAGMIGGHRFAARCFAVEQAAQAGAGCDPGLLGAARTEFEALRAALIAAVPAPPGEA